MKTSTAADLILQAVACLTGLYIIFSYLGSCHLSSSKSPVSSSAADGQALARQADQRAMIGKLRAEIAHLDAELRELETQKQASRLAVKAPASNPELDVVPWEFITDSLYYLTENAQMGMSAHAYSGPFAERRFELKPLIEHTRTLASDLAGMKHIANTMQYRQGFVHFHPLNGTTAKMFFSSQTGTVMNLYLLHATRHFYAPSVVNVTRLKKNSHLLHMIMPLAGRLDKLESFLDTFLLAYKRDTDMFLTIVYFGTDGLEGIQKLCKARLGALHSKKPVYRILKKPMPFSRGGGLQHGATSSESWPKTNDLKAAVLFFIDVDMMFDNAMLLRCRLLPQPGKRVFYPVVFSQYNPDIAYRDQDDIPKPRERTDHNYTSGLWRTFGFGMACLHYKDFLASGGFDLKIKGWGAEDVLLYRKFLQQHKVTTMRAIDRGLFHVFHEKVCDKKLSADQMRMCQGSKGVSEASHEQMAYLLYT